MRVSTQRKLSLYVLISLIIIVCASISKNDTNISVLAILQTILYTVFFVSSTRRIIGIDFLFILFSGFVHLSQYVVTGCNLPLPLDQGFYMKGLVSTKVYLYSGVYTIIVQQALMAGSIFFRQLLRINRRRHINPCCMGKLKQFWRADNKTLKSMGFILLVVGVLPSLYLDIMKIIYSVHDGYLATYRVPGASSGILNYFSSLWKYGVILLVFAHSNNRTVARGLVLSSFVYLLLSMLSGNRISALMHMVTIIYVYYVVFPRKHKLRNRLKSFVKLFFLGYLMLVFLNFIYLLRNGEKHLLYRSFASPLELAVSTFSVTIATVCYSVRFFPDMGIQGNGITYLTGWLTILPNFGEFLSGFTQYNQFTANIPFPYIRFLGGSLIGELFFNFREFGWVAAVFIGCLLGCIANFVEEKIESQKYLCAMTMIVIVPSLLQWPRDYFAAICRPFIWTNALLVLMHTMFVRKQRDGYRS